MISLLAKSDVCRHQWLSRNMDLCSRDSEEGFILLGIQRCHTVNEQMNFLLHSYLDLPVCRVDDPILECDFTSPNRRYHGSGGVDLLSWRSFVESENLKTEQSLTQFNSFAEKAATISVSAFRPAATFGLHSVSEMWNNLKRKTVSSKKESTRGGDSKHGAMSNEGLRTGNFPIAKSCRAVRSGFPDAANARKPPPCMKLKCPTAVANCHAALVPTASPQNLCPQPLPTIVHVIGFLVMVTNVLFGISGEPAEKFSPSWLADILTAVLFIVMLVKFVLMPEMDMVAAIHAAVSCIAMLGKCVLMPHIRAFVLGLVIGSMAELYRLKADARISCRFQPKKKRESAADWWSWTSK